MYRIPVGAYLPLAGLICAFRSTVVDAQVISRSAVVSAVAAWKVPGVAVAEVKKDRVVAAFGVGVLRAGDSTSVDANSIFAIGSNTKAFTSAAIALLVSDRKLAWDDKVERLLPTFQINDSTTQHELTLRDVLSHRSGFGSYQGDMLFARSAYDRAEVLRRVSLLRPTAAIRSRYAYSNIMYLVAGEVLAQQSSVPWEQVIDQRLLKPLRMSRTFATFAAVRRQSNVASHHDLRGQQVVPIEPTDTDNGAPAAGLSSTATDMARWLRMLLAGGMLGTQRIVPQAMLAETMSPQTIIPGPAGALFPSTHFRAYGFGWVLQDYRGRKVVWHLGGIGGMKSIVALVPEEDYGIVILTNRADTMLPEAVAWQAIDEVLGGGGPDRNAEWLQAAVGTQAIAAAAERRADSVRQANVQPTLLLSRYVGRYTHPVYGVLEVTVDDGFLRISSLLDIRGRLMHWERDVFRYAYDDGPGNYVDFVLDTAGNIAAIRINRTVRFERDP